MICELCTIDVVSGIVWRTPAVKSGSASFPAGFVLCGGCKSAVDYARREPVDEQLPQPPARTEKSDG